MCARRKTGDSESAGLESAGRDCMQRVWRACLESLSCDLAVIRPKSHDCQSDSGSRLCVYDMYEKWVLFCTQSNVAFCYLKR